MLTHRFSKSAVLQAPPEKVYHVIADYHQQHPQIIPKPPFVSLKVEKGGFGAGTHLYVEMKVLGKIQGFRGLVSEPDPGRKLIESYDTGYVTSFEIEARGPQSSFVRIATEIPFKPGLAAYLERLLIPRFLRPVYTKELGLIEATARRLS